MSPAPPPPLLEVDGLSKDFPVRGRGLLRRERLLLNAVDGVRFSVPPGSSFGIAGESGSGKSTLMRMILLLERPSAGAIRFAGRDVLALNGDLGWYRRQVQAVFQDATSSLNPHFRVEELVAEPLLVQERALPRAEVRRRAIEMLGRVGLPAQAARSFPHELSGGQRQRVAIARALIIRPKLVVLDEPVSALDVSVRSQVLNLLIDLQQEQGLTYLIVSHDLALLRHVTDRLAVMYMGRLVEAGDSEKLIGAPLHPFTRGLLEASPQAAPGRARPAPAVLGEIGNPLHPPPGCRFHPRCPFAEDRCRVQTPVLKPASPGQAAACWVFNP